MPESFGAKTVTTGGFAAWAVRGLGHAKRRWGNKEKLIRLRILTLVAAIGAPLSPLPAASQTVTQTPIWTRFSVEVTSEKDYDNPLLDVEVLVEFTGPGGSKTTVPAFWDYGRSWKARFSPNRTGTWTYRFTASDTSNAGIHGQQGRFECVPYRGENPLYKHGAIDTAPDGAYFAHTDGTPFFWLGDTAWNGALLSSADEWDTFLQDRRHKRFSVIQFVVMQWRSAAGDENGRPAFIIHRGKLEVDPIFFQRMDQRIDAINEHGLVAAPVMFWAHSNHATLNPGQFLSDEQKVLVGRYMIARYGAHHLVWILGGDGAYEGEHAERWRRVGRELFGAGKPGIPHPVTVHCNYWCEDAFGTEDWWTFNGYQPGHRRQQSLERVTQGEPTTFHEKHPKRPSLNLEFGYEAHRNRTRGAPPEDVFDALDIRRFAYYSLFAAPPAGLTYGAHGIWGWHPRAEEPMTHPGTGVGPAWHDAIALPGSTHLKRMAELLARFDWTKLRPAQHLLAGQPGRHDLYRWVAAARTEDGSVLLVYAPPGTSVKLRRDAVSTPTVARWYSPRSGEWVRAAGADGETLAFDPPNQEDWVLWLGAEQP